MRSSIMYYFKDMMQLSLVYCMAFYIYPYRNVKSVNKL